MAKGACPSPRRRAAKRAAGGQSGSEGLAGKKHKAGSGVACTTSAATAVRANTCNLKDDALVVSILSVLDEAEEMKDEGGEAGADSCSHAHSHCRTNVDIQGVLDEIFGARLGVSAGASAGAKEEEKEELDMLLELDGTLLCEVGISVDVGHNGSAHEGSADTAVDSELGAWLLDL